MGKISKSVKKMCLVSVLSLSMVGTQMMNTGLWVQATTESQGTEAYVEANFYLLKSGCNRPSGTGAQPVSNYQSVGKGYIYSKTEAADDDEAVAKLIAQAPDCSEYLAEDEMVVWYVVKEAKKDKWNVDGEIVKKPTPTVKPTETPEPTVEPTQAPEPTVEPTVAPTPKPVWCGFEVLKFGEERPTTFDVSGAEFQWGNFGYITKGIEIANQPEIVNNMVVELPNDVNKYLEENEAVRWFTVKRVGYGWRIYGEIYNEKVESSQASYNDADYIMVDTVKDIENINEKLKNGAVIETKGFYEIGDGGAAKYEVCPRSNKTNYMTFTTQVGQYANYIMENDCINVKQLGAGVCEPVIDDTNASKENNDDSGRINEAIGQISGQGGGTVYLPEGEYRCADKIHAGSGNYILKGEDKKAVIYTDNGYKGKDEHFITISGGTNIELDGLRVEARETRKVSYYRQCSIMFSAGVKIRNCEFIVDKNVISYDGNTDRQYTNITLYSGWHDVVIDNCIMEQMGCVERGACLGVIDMWNNQSSNVTVTNCIMKQNAHDEMIGIFTTSKDTAGIDGVYIANNKMYTASASNVSKKTMAITVSYDVSKNVKNVVIENNYIKAEIPTNFMTFGTIENCKIANNTFDVVKTSNMGVLFDTRKGVTIENNKIQVSATENGSVGSVFKRYGEFKNNEIVCDCPVSSVMCNGGKAYDNTVIINSGCTVLAVSPEEVIGNKFYMRSFVKNFISYDSLSYDSTITGNIFDYQYDDTKEAENIDVWTGCYAVYAGFHAGINGYTVTFSDNVIKSESCLARNKHLLGYGVGNSEPQKFVIENNKVGKYTGIRSFYGAWGDFTLKNNTNEEGQELKFDDVKVMYKENYQ